MSNKDVIKEFVQKAREAKEEEEYTLDNLAKFHLKEFFDDRLTFKQITNREFEIEGSNYILTHRKDHFTLSLSPRLGYYTVEEIEITDLDTLGKAILKMGLEK